MTQQVLQLWSLIALRNSCNAVWKSVQHQQLLFIYLLYLLSQYQFCECKQANPPNHRIQRRFMWKEMDVMDSMLRRMVSGSRFIKNIIGESAAPKKYILKPPSSLGNYLPIETTKVKYIFKDPLTKETKVITMRPSQKIIRPIFDYLVDNKSPKTSTANPKDKVRQLERDKEVLAEKQTSPNKFDDNNNNKKVNTNSKDSEVIRGKIAELDNSWQPMQLETSSQSGVKSSSPPKAISQLHTSFMTDTQGKEKLNSATSSNPSEVTSVAPHTYEVTETDSEETIHLPFTNEYLSIPKLNNIMQATVTETAVATNTDNDGDYFTQTAAVTTLSPIIVSTVDDETPNYPTYFLQRLRERPQSDSSYTTAESLNSTLQSLPDNNWKLYQNPNQEHTTNNNNLRQKSLSPPRRQHRNKSVNWASTETVYQNSNRFDASTSTSTSSNEASSGETTNTTTESSQSHIKHLRKNGQLKSSTAPATTAFTSEETTKRSKQRGSVKFGTKIRTNHR